MPARQDNLEVRPCSISLAQQAAAQAALSCGGVFYEWLLRALIFTVKLLKTVSALPQCMEQLCCVGVSPGMPLPRWYRPLVLFHKSTCHVATAGLN